MGETTNSSRTKLFLRILEAELKDLIEDIKLVELRQQESYARMKTTQYVFKENSALLGMELECLQALLKRIFTLKASSYADCDALAEAVMEEARSFVAKFEYPESIVAFMGRKIGKVKRYFDEPEE